MNLEKRETFVVYGNSNRTATAMQGYDITRWQPFVKVQWPVSSFSKSQAQATTLLSPILSHPRYPFHFSTIL